MPLNITVSGTGPTAVTWTPPTATDDLDPVPVITSSHAPGATFALGTTTVSYTATDASGNFTTGSFKVTVAAGALQGGGGNDTVTGGTGNDTAAGGQGNDIVDGGAGDDAVSGGAGDDVVNGGTGNDTAKGGQGNDTVDGGEGDDAVSGGIGNDVVNGGAGNDTVHGDDGNDVVDGGAGDDSVNGGTGDDVVFGGAGTDRVQGGAGNDLVDGGEGNDDVSGGAGNDILHGGQGSDELQGGDGDDVLLWDAADTIRSGGEGTDLLVVDEVMKRMMDDGMYGALPSSFYDSLAAAAVDDTIDLTEDAQGIEAVLTGQGADKVSLSLNGIKSSGSFVALLGDGQDTLTIRTDNKPTKPNKPVPPKNWQLSTGAAAVGSPALAMELVQRNTTTVLKVLTFTNGQGDTVTIYTDAEAVTIDGVSYRV